MMTADVLLMHLSRPVHPLFGRALCSAITSERWRAHLEVAHEGRLHQLPQQRVHSVTVHLLH